MTANNILSDEISHILYYLKEGKKKVVTEEDDYKITGYWVGPMIRIDIQEKEMSDE